MSTAANPYQPPTTETLDYPREEATTEIASKWQRFGTFIVDYFSYMALSFAIGIGIAMMGQEAIDAITSVPDFVLGLPIFLGYYCFFEGIWGRTPGKFVFGTKVVDAHGDKPSFGRTLGRAACRMIPFEPLSFLGTRGWHDSITHTYVVRTRSR